MDHSSRKQNEASKMDSSAWWTQMNYTRITRTSGQSWQTQGTGIRHLMFQLQSRFKTNTRLSFSKQCRALNSQRAWLRSKKKLLPSAKVLSHSRESESEWTCRQAQGQETTINLTLDSQVSSCCSNSVKWQPIAVYNNRSWKVSYRF